MPTDPQTPDGGYALTPETAATDTADHATGDASTAHYEELLASEAAAARRGNRAIARFAVVGLVAALAVGFVTWRNAVPADNSAEDSPVVDASVDTSLRTTQTLATSPPRPRAPATQEVAPPPVTIGGLAPLSEDPYLPPNAWNGGDTLAPGTPTQSLSRPGTGATATGAPDETPTLPELPTLPMIPTIPTIPTFPEPTDGSSTGETTPEETPGNSEEPEEPDASGTSAPVAPAPTTDVGEPTELTEPTG